MKWSNPVPHGARRGVRVYRPSDNLQRVADEVCASGWRGLGVRVFAWPCGTLVVVHIDTTSDERLLKLCGEYHLATYARRASPQHGFRDGPQRRHVLEDLAWARSTA